MLLLSAVVRDTRRDEARRVTVALCRRIMIRNLYRVASPIELRAIGTRAKHAMVDVLTERVPFSRDFLFRQVTRTRRVTSGACPGMLGVAANVI